MKAIMLSSLGFILATLLWQAPVTGQTHAPWPRAEGELRGIVMDPQQARVPGARIRVENKSHSFEVETDEEGAFRLRLPGGDYNVRVEYHGFKAFNRKRVRIEADKTETISVTLRPAPPEVPLKIR